MFDLIKKIFGLCVHNYEIIEKANLFNPPSKDNPNNLPHGVKYTQRCKKCGKIKATRIY